MAVYSGYTRVFEGAAGQFYPEIRTFLTALLAGQLGYRVVYDRSSRESPAWLYPKEIVFVDGRMVILERYVPGDG